MIFCSKSVKVHLQSQPEDRHTERWGKKSKKKKERKGNKKEIPWKKSYACEKDGNTIGQGNEEEIWERYTQKHAVKEWK